MKIRRISSIRQYLTVEATTTLVCACVLSKLDYCNSLLSGCPLYFLRRLQNVQNSAAKLVFKSHKRNYVQLLQALHWLPVQARVDYKLSTICHSFFSDSSSAYLSDLFTVYTPSRQLCSSADTRTFCIPHIKSKTFGQCSLLLLWSTAMEFSPFWHPIHSVFPCLQNSNKDSPLQTILQQLISDSVFFLS